MTTASTWVGRSRPALEGREIVTGELVYVTDRRMPGMLHGHVLRSTVPHARIDAVDVAAAKALPGVACVLTAADVPVNALGPRDVDGPVLADGVVRQVGEAIALVAARDARTAEQAAGLIRLELTPLPVVDGPAAAAAPDAPRLHAGGNVSGRIAFASGAVDPLLADAHLVLRREVRTPGQEHVAIETPGGVAVHEAGSFTIWCGSQNPGLHQRKVARALDVDPNAVRMIANPVGGAFGSRNDDPMPVYLALLARATGRPVHVHMTREDVMAAGAKRHPFVTSIEIGFDSRGTILGSSVNAVADTGPVITSGPNVMKTSAEMSTGPYGFDVASFDGTVYYTNNANAGAFRGYGVPQVAFAVENAMTEAAHRLGLDPVEIRLRNVLDGGDRHSLYRHRTTTSLAVRETLQTAAAHPLWADRAAWQAEARGPWRRGTGVATAMKGVGMGSGTGDTARARLRIDERGHVTIWAGPNHTGQSIQTTYGQVAADALGLPIEHVDVRVGDTGEVPESGPTAASRSTYAGGNAVRLACEELVERCRQLALPFATDAASAGTKLVELGEADVVAEFRLPDTDDIGIVPPDQLATFAPHRVYGTCTQVVRVEVNVHTGELRVPELLCVLDCGTPINPAATIGQAEGGILQGLGLAVMEEHLLVAGVPRTTSLENYLAPTITDTPLMTTLFVPGREDSGPFGAKGMSEVVVVPTPPAIAAAILDAVGVLPRELPVTPERLLTLLEEAPCA
ncbi:aldehyde oxidase and xanthine dehydrogenase molybdopterin binding [Beutenbergia cavernae DSM 12333]|uniref:Aldehyde oxidase and xanthine dehydrogenase molybdopterin binding n=1 Tax=Beutenbergia cavernae (strain ATCC BAA-8 / DSM 12333 / CCUG 43141 / JCM 11478 / NBRC 16432 / NCIMB 13614 / HKI 0122) TaxID=471853 RepID=C5C417_BEUC1|nr:xanthine dehydrogenase family protein molybdopterin-binding subunit [Beutenbergia cavernae]ACQ79930.1 aldehyde oxidase and xanthine dehydrogenase molybdopterin binding [Beutenbergia cavernae DSM 12333]